MVEKLQHHVWHALLVLAILFAMEGFHSSPFSEAQTVTTIQLSIVAAPFSMQYRAYPQTRWHQGQAYFSPGIIKVREHRQELSGWQIVGRKSDISPAEQDSNVIVEIVPVGQSRIEGLSMRGNKIVNGVAFTLVEAPAGQGRGVFEIRPYFSMQKMDHFGNYEFTAL